MKSRPFRLGTSRYLRFLLCDGAVPAPHLPEGGIGGFLSSRRKPTLPLCFEILPDALGLLLDGRIQRPESDLLRGLVRWRESVVLKDLVSNSAYSSTAGFQSSGRCFMGAALPSGQYPDVLTASGLDGQPGGMHPCGRG